jgi:hypothetical protein
MPPVLACFKMLKTVLKRMTPFGNFRRIDVGGIKRGVTQQETDLASKAKALAACDPGGGHRRIKKKWRDDPIPWSFCASSERTYKRSSFGELMSGRWKRRPPSKDWSLRLAISGLRTERKLSHYFLVDIV